MGVTGGNCRGGRARLGVTREMYRSESNEDRRYRELHHPRHGLAELWFGEGFLPDTRRSGPLVRQPDVGTLGDVGVELKPTAEMPSCAGNNEVMTVLAADFALFGCISVRLHCEPAPMAGFCSRSFDGRESRPLAGDVSRRPACFHSAPDLGAVAGPRRCRADRAARIPQDARRSISGIGRRTMSEATPR